MPWSKTNLPPSASNLKGHDVDIFVAAANAALKTYKDDVRAIKVGLAAVAKNKDTNVSKSLIDSFMKFLHENFGDKGVKETSVTKSVDEEKKMALFVVLAPDEIDLHGDIYDESEVEKAANNFNEFCMKANLFHRAQTDSFKIMQSFITPAAFSTDDGRYIKKGSWLTWLRFDNDDLWDLVKSNKVTGVSIGAKANVEEL